MFVLFKGELHLKPKFSMFCESYLKIINNVLKNE